MKFPKERQILYEIFIIFFGLVNPKIFYISLHMKEGDLNYTSTGCGIQSLLIFKY